MATDARLEQLWRDQWAGMPAWRGTLPRVPQRAELPTASEALAGCLVRIPGASGVADATYECQKGTDDAYSWVQVDAGGSGPLGLLGLDAISNVTFSGTNTYVVTVTATVVSGRVVRMQFMGTMSASAADGVIVVESDASGITTFGAAPVATTLDEYNFIWIVSPTTSGSQDFKFGMRSAAGATITIGFAQFTVEDIGAAA